MTNSPFHDPQQNPLPDANDIEQEVNNSIELYSLKKAVNTQGPSPHIKQDIKRLKTAILWLLAIGAVAGGVLGIGVAVLLKHYGLVGPQQPNQSHLPIQPENPIS